MKLNIVYKYLDEDVAQYWLMLELRSSQINAGTDKVFSCDCIFENKNRETDIYALPIICEKMFNGELIEFFNYGYEIFNYNKKELYILSITLNGDNEGTEIEMCEAISQGLNMIIEWIKIDFKVFKSEKIEG